MTTKIQIKNQITSVTKHCLHLLFGKYQSGFLVYIYIYNILIIK